MTKKVLIRGGGDLATGVAHRLRVTGHQVLIAELPQPLVVRRLVSFAEAVYAGEHNVEGVTARLVTDDTPFQDILREGHIPVIVDSQVEVRHVFKPFAIIDARLTKKPPKLDLINEDAFVIGLGPGFIAGDNCHAVVETIRGHDLGRVIWSGAAEPDTRIPEAVLKKQGERVLRAPADGELVALAQICDLLKPGDLIAEVNGNQVTAPFKGILRGLLKEGLVVQKGMKIGDLDPRDNPRYCTTISDKARAVGGGVLEALMSMPGNMTGDSDA